MSRWEPNASDRLREAAMQLFGERGYELTTVADISDRAGVTSRTFFRHFTDKREVLFNGSDILERHLLTAVEDAPKGASAMEIVAAAVDAMARLLTDRAFSRKRQAIIDANPELQERELIKMATLANALADGLRKRGFREPDATIAAETGTTIFRVAFAQWVGKTRGPSLAKVVEAHFARLRALAV